MVQSGAHACSYTHVYILARVHADRWRLYEICIVPRNVQSSEKVTGSSMSDWEPRGWRARKRSWWKCTHYQSSIFMKVSWHRRRCRRMTKQNPGGPRLCKEKCTYCPSDRVSHFEPELWVGYVLIRNGNVYIDTSKMKCSDMRIPRALIFYTS